MPQISQLPVIFFSQLFWLLVVFGVIFFGIGRGMLPKIQSTVDAREKKIAEDLSQAQAARAGAEETEAAWRARMDAARAIAVALFISHYAPRRLASPRKRSSQALVIPRHGSRPRLTRSASRSSPPKRRSARRSAPLGAKSKPWPAMPLD